MKVAVLLLCHEAPALLSRRLASAFFASPDVKVYIHYDARRSDAELQVLRQSIPEGVQVDFVTDRVR